MAAAKKRKTTQRKTASKKKTQSPSLLENRLFRLSVLLVAIIISILALLHIGIVGSFFFQIFNYLFGLLAYVVWLAIILYCMGVMSKFDFSIIKPRKWIGAILLFISTSLFLGMVEYDQISFWSGFENTWKLTKEILFHGQRCTAGLLGNFLSGSFGSLFDSLGTILFLAFMFILSIVLMGYSTIKEWIQSYPRKDEDDYFESEQPIIHQNGVEIEPITTPGVDINIFEEEPKKKVSKKVNVPEPIDSSKVKPVVEKSNEPKHYMDYGQAAYASYKLPKLSLLEDVTRASGSNSNMNAAKSQGKKLIEIFT